MSSNKKKSAQLGMPHGTAQGRLRKLVLFDLLKNYRVNICYRCSRTIDHADELSMEHKKPWLDSEDPKKLFWDLDNIAFSHLSCNSASARKYTRKKQLQCGTRVKYMNHGCRCDACSFAASEHREKYR